MLKPLLTQLLHHLVNQNSWAKDVLLPFAGKSVRFKIPPFDAMITILEDGGLAMAGETTVPEATVTIPFPAALRLLADDESANTLITLEGDTELVSSLAKVLRNVRWEYEEDLSRLIGDVAAYQLGKFSRRTVSEAKRQAFNIAEMFSEYWQEEEPLIAKKRHVENFLKEVDALRENVERFEKRLEKLSATSKTPLKKKPRSSPKKKSIS